MNEKEQELAKKYGVERVYELIVYPKGEEPAIAYVKEPTLQAKMVAMNKISSTEMLHAGDTILQTSLLKEESDPRINKDRVYLALCLKAAAIIEVAGMEQKKS